MLLRFSGRAALFFGAIVLLVGCSANSGTEVHGTVTVDGIPAEEGTISFVPEGGKGATGGGTIKGGQYLATKLSPGSAKVQIRVPKVVGTKKAYDAPNSPVHDVKKESLPSKYNEKTELIYEIQPGKNEKNWELTTK